MDRSNSTRRGAGIAKRGRTLLIEGKGGKVGQVMLPEIVSRWLLSLRGDAGANDPVFVSCKGRWLRDRTVNDVVKHVRPRWLASMRRFFRTGCARPWSACHRARRHLPEVDRQ
jgi:hypothetical protein